MAILLITTTLLLILTTAILYRLWHILSHPRPKSHRTRGQKTHLLIILGSGGHTAEMLAMLTRSITSSDQTQRLDWTDYTHRTWVTGTNDTISAQRAKEFEQAALQASEDNLFTNLDSRAEGKLFDPGTSVIVTVPRAREIHQPLLTTPISSLRCLGASLIVLLQNYSTGRGFPDVVLCNGPATATILILATVLLRFFDVGGCQSRGKMRTVYVESWARVQRLSLSGKLLVKVVDRFLVQWEQLERATGGKGEYLGVLV